MTAAGPAEGGALLEQADTLVDLERYGQARETLRPWVQAYPEDPEALLLLARCAIGEGGEAGIREALHLTQQVLLARPDDEHAHRIAALCNAALRRRDAALAHADTAIRLQPWSWVGYATRAQVDLVGSRVDDATVAAAQHAVSVAPLEPATHVLLGQVYNAKVDSIAARAALTEALRLDPENADAHRALGEARTTQLGLKDAVRTYRRAAALRPDDPRIGRDLAGVVRRFFTTFSVFLLLAAGIGILLRNTDHARVIYVGAATAALWRPARRFRRVLGEAGRDQRRAIRRATPGIVIRTTGLVLALLTFWIAPLAPAEHRLTFFLVCMGFVVGSAVLSGFWRSFLAGYRAARSARGR